MIKRLPCLPPQTSQFLFPRINFYFLGAISGSTLECRARANAARGQAAMAGSGPSFLGDHWSKPSSPWPRSTEKKVCPPCPFLVAPWWGLEDASRSLPRKIKVSWARTENSTALLRGRRNPLKANFRFLSNSVLQLLLLKAAIPHAREKGGHKVEAVSAAQGWQTPLSSSRCFGLTTGTLYASLFLYLRKKHHLAAICSLALRMNYWPDWALSGEKPCQPAGGAARKPRGAGEDRTRAPAYAPFSIR